MEFKIGVIVVAFNALKWDLTCFEPLAKNIPSNAHVYIIDNASVDGTSDLIREKYPEYNLYESKANLGFGKANNIGFKLALDDGCTNFLLLNQDAFISWNNIIALVRLQGKLPEYGIISPIQLYNAEKVDHLHLKSLMKESYTYFNDLICDDLVMDVYDIGYTNAAIWMLSRACIEKVGGFDPIFPHYGEDNDYANRVNYFGFKVGLAAKLKAYHYRDQDKVLVRKSMGHYYTQFLVRAKAMHRRTLMVYFQILKELLLGSLNKKGDFGNVKSWRAFLKLIVNYRVVVRHKKRSSNERFLFLDL